MRIDPAENLATEADEVLVEAMVVADDLIDEGRTADVTPVMTAAFPAASDPPAGPAMITGVGAGVTVG